MATFLRRPETYHAVAGVAYRPEGGYARDLEVDIADIARTTGTSIGGTPDGPMGLPGSSDDEELDARRDWGVWAPDALAPAFERGLRDLRHQVVDDPA